MMMMKTMVIRAITCRGNHGSSRDYLSTSWSQSKDWAFLEKTFLFMVKVKKPKLITLYGTKVKSRAVISIFTEKKI